MAILLPLRYSLSHSTLISMNKGERIKPQLLEESQFEYKLESWRNRARVLELARSIKPELESNRELES